jgi:hypothetical protein
VAAVVEPRGHQRVVAQRSAGAPRLDAVERHRVADGVGAQHRVGAFRAPHAPQLAFLGCRPGELVEDHHRVGVLFGQPARGHVHRGQVGQLAPPLRRLARTRQRQAQLTGPQPVHDQTGRH